MSQVTVSIGLRAVTGVPPPPPNVQMTRRIGKVAIHSNYNALKFVSCHDNNSTEVFLPVLDWLILIWVRPITLPS
jgi:hypothetical protein